MNDQTSQAAVLALVLALRREHKGKFRMRDLPVSVMKKLIRSWE